MVPLILSWLLASEGQLTEALTLEVLDDGEGADCVREPRGLVRARGGVRVLEAARARVNFL